MMYNPYKKESLYIAGPECFYNRGYSLWYSQKQLAEYYGFNVALPTSTNYKLDSKDLRENAQEIFRDLIDQVEKTTTIIADLEFFRGCEPDSGTIFEIGWIYSKGGKCYGYTRDIRNMVVKNQKAKLKDNKVVDGGEKLHPYYNLPFCPSLCASTKLVEGNFESCLKTLMQDINEERRLSPFKNVEDKREIVECVSEKKEKIVYLASPNRYDESSKEYFDQLKSKYEKMGYKAISPLDNYIESDNEDPYFDTVVNFHNRLKLIDNCDYVVASLDGFHGLETNNDVSFECGYAYGKGKKLIGVLQDARTMREKIPSLDNTGYDFCDNVIENFDYPINLMFACSMEIIEGSELNLVDNIIKKLEG